MSLPTFPLSQTIRNIAHLSDHQVSQIENMRSFSGYTRTLISGLLSNDVLEARPVNDNDTLFFDELNAFLQAEGESPIELNEHMFVPKQLSELLVELFDGRVLNEQEHIFNTSDDAKDRGANPERQRHVANLFQAISDYYEAEQPDKAPQEKTLRLWKREMVADEQGQLQAELKEVDRIDFNEYAVLSMGGVTCQHTNPQYMNGMMKQAEEMLGGKEIYQQPINGKKIAMYCISYEPRNRMSFNAEIHAANADVNHYISEEATEFVRATLLPSLGLEQGHTLKSSAELRSCLRKLNLFSSSYGTTMVLQLRNAVSEALLEAGYDKAQVREALSEVYSLNIHPTCHIEETIPESGSFSSIYVVSQNDVTTRSRTDHLRLIPSGKTPPSLIPVNEQTVIMYRDTPTEAIELTSDAIHAAEEGGEPRGNGHLLGKSGFQKGHDTRLEILPSTQPDGTRFDFAGPIQQTLRRGVFATTLNVMDTLRLGKEKMLGWVEQAGASRNKGKRLERKGHVRMTNAEADALMR